MRQKPGGHSWLFFNDHINNMDTITAKQIKIETSDLRYRNSTPAEIKKLLFVSYKKLIGVPFVNKDLNIKIEFINDSVKKLSYGSKFYSKKASLLDVVKPIIEEMKYNNWGKRKPSDKSTVVGYFNFKCTVFINGFPEYLRIAIQVRTNGRFYYNHELNIY